MSFRLKKSFTFDILLPPFRTVCSPVSYTHLDVYKRQDYNHDKWVGVGGKFERFESPEDCLLREVWEETGLKLEAWQFRGIVTFVSDRLPTEYMLSLIHI